MKKLLMLFLVFPIAVSAGQGADYVSSYLKIWLENHEFNDFEVKDNKIHFTKKDIVLDGEIYGVNELEKNERYSIETRLTANFGERKLDEFVVGVGKSPEAAFFDSLENFCMTTLHPIYAEFFNHDDPHVKRKKWKIGNKERNIFISEWGIRGELPEKNNLEEVEEVIRKKLSQMELSDDIHWVKLVASNIEGKMGMVVLAVDGYGFDEINEELKKLDWPKTETFYLLKLFLVIGKI